MSPLNLQWHVTTKPTAVTKYCASINQWIHQFQNCTSVERLSKQHVVDKHDNLVTWHWQHYIILSGTEGKDWETSEGIFVYWIAVQLAYHGWRQEHHKIASHCNWSLNIYIYGVPWVIKMQLISRDVISLCYCNLIIVQPIQSRKTIFIINTIMFSQQFATCFDK